MARRLCGGGEPKNGTCVQSEPIKGPTVLNDGDEIEFGSVKVWFIVERPDDPTTLTM
ncbi:MAG: FHA domain-containing protein [Acidobacteriota bacterium]|nr:FHA domain-containing protein [Acidobacteriota bacterium]